MFVWARGNESLHEGVGEETRRVEAVRQNHDAAAFPGPRALGPSLLEAAATQPSTQLRVQRRDFGPEAFWLNQSSSSRGGGGSDPVDDRLR